MKLRENTVAVFGLGRVGSTLAASLLKNGFVVFGVDKDDNKLKRIREGPSLYPDEPFIDDILKKHCEEGKLLLTSDGIKASKASRYKVLTVPIPLKARLPSFTDFKEALTEIAKGTKRGDVIIVESSVPPGTSRYVALPILETFSGLSGEKDFYLVYSPERLFEGRALKDLEENYPKVVAGLGPKSLREGMDFYSKIAKKGVLTLSSLEAAEVEKLVEGIYRDVNIALANEIALACESLGVDFWEVRRAANSQPFCHLHLPGTGVGGSCIPIYPYYFLSTVKGISLELIESSRKRNDEMPKTVALLFDEFIHLKNFRVEKVTILGLAFRGNVSDDRNSPTYDLIRELRSLGYKVRVHDPMVTKPSKRVKVYRSLKGALKGAQAVIIAVDHSAYLGLDERKLEELMGTRPVIFDARGILDRSSFDEERLRVIGVAPKVELEPIPID
jgi:hypothetical protein